MADKATMPYMIALITEVQRRASIVIVSHLCTSDQVIGGKPIPAGANVVYNLHAVMRHDPVFEEPDDFKPERFLQDDGKTFRKVLHRNMSSSREMSQLPYWF
ncbi:Protein CYP-14A1 [Aphelenchoides avenae]|nr:Protein CYP-14A1 [Aphelenchus avenae]